MRILICCAALLASISALAVDHQSTSPVVQFELGRHTHFDFGPPFDYYEVFLVRPVPNGTSIERIILAPPGNACTKPATVEIASTTVNKPVAAFLGKTDPCAIPEEKISREAKRCKDCLIFSSASIAVQAQCGSQPRTVRFSVLDKDMFDANAGTPEYTSWAMGVTKRLDRAVGPGVMEKPAFSSFRKETPLPLKLPNSKSLTDISAGVYDGLFEGSKHKPSDLYRAAVNRPLGPDVRLARISLQPEAFVRPVYPSAAIMDNAEGTVHIQARVDADGALADVSAASGPPVFLESAKKAASLWKFPRTAAGQHIEATLDFSLNCPESLR
jgi:TonB family protein